MFMKANRNYCSYTTNCCGSYAQTVDEVAGELVYVMFPQCAHFVCELRIPWERIFIYLPTIKVNITILNISKDLEIHKQMAKLLNILKEQNDGPQTSEKKIQTRCLHLMTNERIYRDIQFSHTSPDQTNPFSHPTISIISLLKKQLGNMLLQLD